MIKISACVIVKNEAKNLPAYLNSVRQIADEIVVVDTGSTDNSKEMALRGGARVYDFEWIDDFAAAKNFALSKVTGDWVIVMDADEYFPDSDIPKVRDLIQRWHRNKNVLGLVCDRLNINVDDNNYCTQGDSQIRIIRNLPTLKYVRPIHEHLNNTGAPGTMQYIDDIVIYHTGYSDSVVRSKGLRNLELLRKEEAETGENPELACYYMDCYAILGDREKVVEYGDKSAKLEFKNVPEDCAEESMGTWIEALASTKAPADKIERAVALARRLYPANPGYSFMLAEYYWRIGEYAVAYRHHSEAIALFLEQKQRRTEAGERVSTRVIGLPSTSYLRLALVERWRGHMAEASELFRLVITTGKYIASNLVEASNGLAGMPVADFVALLNTVYDKEKDAAWLVNTLVSSAHSKAVLYYQQYTAEVALTDSQKFALAGKTEAAVAALADSMNEALTVGSLLADSAADKEWQLYLPTAYRELATEGVINERTQRLKRRLNNISKSLKGNDNG